MFLCMVAHPSSDNCLGGVVLYVTRSVLCIHSCSMRLGVFIRHTCVLDIMCLAIPLVSVYHTRHHQHALPCVASHHQATHGHKSEGFSCAVHV